MRGEGARRVLATESAMKDKLSHIGETARSRGYPHRLFPQMEKMAHESETEWEKKTSCKHVLSRNSMLETINDIDASLLVC